MRKFDRQKLRRIRQRAGLTQTELHRLSGVEQHTISTIESGKHTPRSATVYRLAEALGVDVGELYEPLPEEAWANDPRKAQAAELASRVEATIASLEEALGGARSGLLDKELLDEDGQLMYQQAQALGVANEALELVFDLRNEGAPRGMWAPLAQLTTRLMTVAEKLALERVEATRKNAREHEEVVG